MSIILVHGIHAAADKGSVKHFGDQLKARGYKTRDFAYTKRWAISMYFPWFVRDDGRALAAFMEPGDHIIAHSNGALVWQRSISAGAKWGKCLIFGGACTSDKFYYPDDCLEKAHIVYNPADKALQFGSKLPYHPFGQLGLRGYFRQPGREDRDDRFKNMNGMQTEALALNHSHYFEGEPKIKWLKYVEEFFGAPTNKENQ